VIVDITSEVVQHLGGLREQFVLYLPEIFNTHVDLMKNPFVVPLENVADCMKDKLIDLRNNSGAKYVFETDKICDFCLKVSDDYVQMMEICSDDVFLSADTKSVVQTHTFCTTQVDKKVKN